MSEVHARLTDLLGNERIRIVSIDGGGLYGLLSAIWLRQLAEHDPRFLEGQSVHLIAGISSGAVNTLLLAKHKNPREALLDRELERFWLEKVGVFTNSNPVTAWLSLRGISAWASKSDFLNQLWSHFGDMKLGDLHQNVLISTFYLNGGSGPVNFEDRNPLAPAHKPYGNPEGQRGWRPKVFTNLRPDDEDLDYRVVDVAYGAATPGGLRAVRGGITDAAVFNASPSVEAIAEVLHEFEAYPELVRENHLTRGQRLDRIAMLSVGDGGTDPSYWLRNFGFGLPLYGLLPTNPLAGQLYPPGTTMPIDAPAQESNFISRYLLGERYFRLDTPLMKVPTIISTLSARWTLWKDFFVERIYTATDSRLSMKAIADCAAFLESTAWCGASSTPAPEPRPDQHLL
ncbi:Phospholipase, patatin family protein [Minicystis rosea]|nr:Phospholipase, patatin family protein [Minicystis rosea]